MRQEAVIKLLVEAESKDHAIDMINDTLRTLLGQDVIDWVFVALPNEPVAITDYEFQ